MISKAYFILMCCLLPLALYAQTDKEQALRARLWDVDNTRLQLTDVPEKWKDESAVILYQEDHYNYYNRGKKTFNPSHNHYRIKLQDRAAIEKFSEISFDQESSSSGLFYKYAKEKTIIGVKIIKPDGTETVLDIEKEKIVQDDVNKVAIPGLEIGDILDIFIYQDDFQRSFIGYHIYDPVERVLSQTHPVLFSRLSVEVEKDYFLNMQSYNGAPEIKEEETGKRFTRRYVMETENIDKSDFPRWFYPLVELPSVKFQVTFALKAIYEQLSISFIAKNDAERKEKVTKDEILAYYDKRFETFSKRKIDDALDYLRANNIKDKREQMIQGLYFVRHKTYNRFIELYVAQEFGNFEPCDTKATFLEEDEFVYYMAGLAKKLDIDYDILVATTDYNGSIDDLLLESNVSYGLRFNFPEPLYFFYLSPHVQADNFPERLEGTEVYVLNVENNKNLRQHQ